MCGKKEKEMTPVRLEHTTVRSGVECATNCAKESYYTSISISLYKYLILRLNRVRAIGECFVPTVYTKRNQSPRQSRKSIFQHVSTTKIWMVSPFLPSRPRICPFLPAFSAEGLVVTEGVRVETVGFGYDGWVPVE